MSQSAYETVKIARGNRRPTGTDYIRGIFTSFFELHGDRRYGDDGAIVGGVALLGKEPVTVIAVMILAITSGDTAMRSLRLSLAEMFNIKQRQIVNRVLLCLPLIAIVAILLYWSNESSQSFNKLWNYFAWGNQVLAASTLMAATVWLIARGKEWSIAIVPGMFMTFIVLCYILWISEAHGGPVGFGLELNNAYRLSTLLTLILAAAAVARGYYCRKKNIL